MNNSSSTAAGAGTIEIGGDLRVNRLGYGAMRITGKGIIGDPPDREVAKAVLRRAVALGVNFIDTADSYGPEVSENLVAEALYPYPEDLVIATKGGLLRPGRNQWTPDGRPEHLREACEGSMRRLKVETIALYQFHRPDPKVPIEESIGEILRMKEEGMVRHVGVCNVTEDELRRARSVAPVVSVQNRYNVSDRTSEAMLDLCEKEHLAFLPWAPILDRQGHGAVQEIAAAHGATSTQVMLAWLLARSPVVLPIPGTGSLAHLDENVAAAGLKLDPSEIEVLTGPS
ncbi:MAG TPA: aldo/keto reductase [Acidimicrobiales bacterium]|nr:aldo/keto reductase [Acidimicrobiales bacterium]